MMNYCMNYYIDIYLFVALLVIQSSKTRWAECNIDNMCLFDLWIATLYFAPDTSLSLCQAISFSGYSSHCVLLVLFCSSYLMWVMTSTVLSLWSGCLFILQSAGLLPRLQIRFVFIDQVASLSREMTYLLWSVCLSVCLSVGPSIHLSHL